MHVFCFVVDVSSRDSQFFAVKKKRGTVFVRHVLSSNSSTKDIPSKNSKHLLLAIAWQPEWDLHLRFLVDEDFQSSL